MRIRENLRKLRADSLTVRRDQHPEFARTVRQKHSIPASQRVRGKQSSPVRHKTFLHEVNDRSPGTVVRSPGTVVRSPGTVVRSPGTVVRLPGTEVRSPRTILFLKVSKNHWLAGGDGDELYRVAQKKRPITFESISALVFDIFA